MQSTGSILIADGVEYVHESAIEYVDARVLDPHWIGVDSNGHEHRAVADGDQVTFPTLIRDADHEPCPDELDGCEGHERLFWACATCRAEVTPGTVTKTFVYNMGFDRYWIAGRPVTEEEFLAAIAAVEAKYRSEQCPSSSAT
jgi:hypothetical protein